MKIDPNRLTLNELEEIEDLAGKSSAELFSGALSARALKAVVYVISRRDNPSITLDEAGAIDMASIEVVTDVDPTGAAG